MTIEGLSSFVLLALVGGLHCAGMCGGFAVMAAGNTQRRRILVQRQLLFLAGKSLTYAMLGFAASLSAGWLVSRFEGIGTEAEVSEMLLGLRSGLARFAGLTMVLFGLGMLGWQRFRS
ncbi:MAG: sulfite exporter TauE/SafE, partial [Planctomycetota bacterium]